MLRAVALVDTWGQIESRLPADWTDALLRLTVADEARAQRAAALLAPAMPRRSGREIRFHCARAGGAAPAALRRLLARLDSEGIAGRLELLLAGEPVAETGKAEPAALPAADGPRRSLAASWDEELGALPPDWSDLFAEVELLSTDHLDRAALLLSPVNPARYGPDPGYRFRVSRSFGYGASPVMARQGLARLDADGIRGVLRVLHVLSDTDPVGTQGPVLRLQGKAV
jgi:hypothetical protein